MSATQCADACAVRDETLQVVTDMFKPANREGQSLAAAVELAEELAARHVEGARTLLDGFFQEANRLPAEMVPVSAGKFPYGEANEPVFVADFSIDRFLVTNQEYERMVPGHKNLRSEYSEADRQPVVNVNWFEAVLYARWRGCRLPTEQEWEKAAGWDAANQHKRIYPWGDEFDAALCYTREKGLNKTTPVGQYPSGRSAYGCEEMAGNVWEWCESPFRDDQDWRVLRGGSFYNIQRLAACAYRYNGNPQDCLSYIGFRCART